MYKLYNNLVNILELNEETIQLYIPHHDFLFKKELLSLTPDTPIFLLNHELRDQLILEFTPENDIGKVAIYARNNAIYLLREVSGCQIEDQNYTWDIQNFHQDLQLRQWGCYNLEIVGRDQNRLTLIDSTLTNNGINFNDSYQLELQGTSRFEVISIATLLMYNIILTYDHFLKEYNVFKVLLNAALDHPSMSVTLINRNEISISNVHFKEDIVLNYHKIDKHTPTKLAPKDIIKHYPNKGLLAIYTINSKRYYFFLKSTGLFVLKSNPIKVTNYKASLHTLPFGQNLYIFGRLTHQAYHSFRKYEHLYIRNSDHLIGKFIRPFPKVKFLKRYGFFKVPITSLDLDDRIHNNLFLGDKERIIHNLNFRRKDKKVKTYILKRHKEKLIVIRTNLQGNITSTIIPFSQEYSWFNRIKIKTAELLARFYKQENKNINLYFEKKSDKADESAFRVFEKVMRLKNEKSINYFILNKKSNHYPYMKKNYGANVLPKYSFKHYLAIFSADYLIASELSNHLLNDRLYIDSIRNKLMSLPLVFLQHGIMFAKPVDNPMAFGFHKDKTSYNMYKSVISSTLEAGEFHKMNYDDEDLILTGLATFDYAKLDPDADRIAFMPTYRYWEEGLIYSNQIKETTYYQTIIKVMNAFEAAGLLDRLLVVPHNKFSEFITNNMPEYSHLLSNNPSEALKISRVFITDYSSAIYDAQYRGAYPIFYWEEKDYLIQQYKAIPPVNEENAPGPIAYSVDELVQFVQHAIQNDYVVEEEFQQKYKQINHFSDNRNTDRIIEFLQSDGIL